MAVVATSSVVCAEDITEDVMLSTVAGAASLTGFAEVVAGDVTSLADAAMVTTMVTISTIAGAASLADAGILFPADPAGVWHPWPLLGQLPWWWLPWPMLGYCSQSIMLGRSQWLWLV